MGEKKWLTPFLKQLFVTSGVSLNTGQFGMVAGYVVAIVPELQKTGSEIPMDDSAVSWFASIHGISMGIGHMIVVKIISTYGRRVGSIISSALSLSGWMCILLADNLKILLLGRFLQGISLGLSLVLGPIIIAECSTPKYRGLFLATSSTCISGSSAFIHYLGTVLHWRYSALFATSIAFIDLLICFYSPETPFWLASKGRIEDCKRVFKWLRGNDGDEELAKIIQATYQISVPTKHSFGSYFKSKKEYVLTMVKKREVYLSITLAVHLYIICYWCGVIVYSSYPVDLIHAVVGNDLDTRIIMSSLDINRVVTSISAVFVVKKFNRRSLLFSITGLNILTTFSVAAYVLARDFNVIDLPYIGASLLHLHLFSIALGALPLPTIISGELFPSAYRSIATFITRIMSCLHIFAAYKSFPDMLKSVHLYGCYSIFGVFCLYAWVVCYFLLPETKDRTLHDIEEELKGKSEKTDTVQALL